MKIRSIRVYQAVPFNRGVETFFSTDKRPNRPPVEITLNKELMSVEIKNDRDHILVPLTNVSVISLDSSVQQEKAKERETESKKKTGMRASQIKKPR